MLPTLLDHRARHAASDAARRRALRSLLTCRGTGSSAAVRVPGRGEYGKTCTFVIPTASTAAIVFANAASSSVGKADDHVGREVEVLERLDARAVLADRVSATHRAQHVVVTRLQRNVKVARDDRRLAHRCDEVGGDVVHLDRREPQALEAVDRSRRPDQPRERHARRSRSRKQPRLTPVSTTSLVTLRDSPPDLVEHGGRRPAARGTAHERDHAERARERAAVLDPDEGADPVEPVIGLDAADRTDVGGDGVDDLLAAAGDTRTLSGRPANASVGRFAAHPVTIDAVVGPRCLGRRLAGLRDRLVGDAAGVDDGDSPAADASL